MAEKEQDSPEPMPFDRLGGFFEDVFTVTRGMATRNMELWSDMSQNLRKEKYKADDMTTDAAKAMSAGLANFQDAWDLLIRFPERERVAATAPTAFLLFQRNVIESAKQQWSCDDSVWIRLPSSNLEKYPEHPAIEITGPDAGVAEVLWACLGTELGTSRQAYRLYTKDLPTHSERLKPGVYSGTIYVDRPPTLIANLRIVLEDDAARSRRRAAKPPAAAPSEGRPATPEPAAPGTPPAASTGEAATPRATPPTTPPATPPPATPPPARPRRDDPSPADGL
jgi:hypothetical protein